MPLQMVNLTIMSSIPELFVQGRIADLQRLLRLAAATAAAPTLACLVIVLWRPAWTLGVVFGPYYSQGASLLLVLALGQIGLRGGRQLHSDVVDDRPPARWALANQFDQCGGAGDWRTAGDTLVRPAGAGGRRKRYRQQPRCGLHWIATRRLLGVWTHFSPRATVRVIGKRGGGLESAHAGIKAADAAHGRQGSIFSSGIGAGP